ncbi:TPA: hypothetical protein WGR05_001521 [Neisseria meningitidis]
MTYRRHTGTAPHAAPQTNPNPAAPKGGHNDETGGKPPVFCRRLKPDSGFRRHCRGIGRQGLEQRHKKLIQSAD